MVKIRLTRTGKKHEPHYRIVATDSRVSRDGKYIEKIGYYNPRTKPPTLAYDKEILTKWIDRGAQMTDTVNDIFVREGIIKQSPKRKKRISLIVEHSKKNHTAESGSSADDTPKADADTNAPKSAEKDPKNNADSPKSANKNPKADADSSKPTEKAGKSTKETSEPPPNDDSASHDDKTDKKQ